MCEVHMIKEIPNQLTHLYIEGETGKQRLTTYATKYVQDYMIEVSNSSSLLSNLVDEFCKFIQSECKNDSSAVVVARTTLTGQKGLDATKLHGIRFRFKDGACSRADLDVLDLLSHAWYKSMTDLYLQSGSTYGLTPEDNYTKTSLDDVVERLTSDLRRLLGTKAPSITILPQWVNHQPEPSFIVLFPNGRYFQVDTPSNVYFTERGYSDLVNEILALNENAPLTT